MTTDTITIDDTTTERAANRLRRRLALGAIAVTAAIGGLAGPAAAGSTTARTTGAVAVDVPVGGYETGAGTGAVGYVCVDDVCACDDEDDCEVMVLFACTGRYEEGKDGTGTCKSRN